jgi:hypothetical protein
MKPNDVRETPRAKFVKLDKEFGFTLDAAATHQNALCERYYTERGLYENRQGRVVQILGADGTPGGLSDLDGRPLAEGLRTFQSAPDASIPGDGVRQHAGLFSKGALGGTLHPGAFPNDPLAPQTRGGLAGSWGGLRCFVNPPFSELENWTDKAWHEWNTGLVPLIVMLVPANRTYSPWWHDNVASKLGGAMRIRWDRHRTLFTVDGGKPILNKAGKVGQPSFACCLLIWQTP